jgi:hypothetical protein
MRRVIRRRERIGGNGKLAKTPLALRERGRG